MILLNCDRSRLSSEPLSYSCFSEEKSQPFQWPVRPRDLDPMPTHHHSVLTFCLLSLPCPAGPLQGSMAGLSSQQDFLTLLLQALALQTSWLIPSPTGSLLKVTSSVRPPGTMLCSTANPFTFPLSWIHSAPLSCFPFLSGTAHHLTNILLVPACPLPSAFYLLYPQYLKQHLFHNNKLIK